jgi:hypothetical protein
MPTRCPRSHALEQLDGLEVWARRAGDAPYAITRMPRPFDLRYVTRPVWAGERDEASSGEHHQLWLRADGALRSPVTLVRYHAIAHRGGGRPERLRCDTRVQDCDTEGDQSVANLLGCLQVLINRIRKRCRDLPGELRQPPSDVFECGAHRSQAVHVKALGSLPGQLHPLHPVGGLADCFGGLSGICDRERRPVMHPVVVVLPVTHGPPSVTRPSLPDMSHLGAIPPRCPHDGNLLDSSQRGTTNQRVREDYAVSAMGTPSS